MGRMFRLFMMAFIMSLGVSGIYYYTVGRKPVPPPVKRPTKQQKKEKLISVLIATSSVEPYERLLSPAFAKEIKLPKEMIPRYAATRIKEIEGKLPTEPIYKGEIICLSRLIDKEDYKESLRKLIPPGYRAITIGVDALSSASGFVTQGDIVDLSAVYDVQVGRKRIKVAKIILQNIKILIVGKKYNPVLESAKATEITGSLHKLPVTFAVTPKDAAIIHHVTQKRGFGGKPSFRILLKNPEDTQIVQTEGFTSEQFNEKAVKELEAKFPNKKKKKKPKKKKYVRKQPLYRKKVVTIEVYKGLQPQPPEKFEVIEKLKPQEQEAGKPNS